MIKVELKDNLITIKGHAGYDDKGKDIVCASVSSIVITTIIFALIHLSPIRIIYAFILGLILNISYEQHKNILAPIIIHIAANTIVIFLDEYNTYILILSLISLTISIVLNTNIKLKKTCLKK